MKELVHSVRSQVIPTRTGNAVVPNRAVAEILHAKKIEKIPNAPKWLHGVMEWRNIKIPILSIDNFVINDEVSLDKKTNIVVFNSSPSNSGLNFFGILANGVPRLIEVTSTSIRVNKEEKMLTNYKMCNVTVKSGEDEIAGFILDIPFIEKEYKSAAKELS